MKRLKYILAFIGLNYAIAQNPESRIETDQSLDGIKTVSLGDVVKCIDNLIEMVNSQNFHIIETNNFETTKKSLDILREAKEKRSEDIEFAIQISQSLKNAVKTFGGTPVGTIEKEVSKENDKIVEINRVLEASNRLAEHLSQLAYSKKMPLPNSITLSPQQAVILSKTVNNAINIEIVEKNRAESTVGHDYQEIYLSSDGDNSCFYLSGNQLIRKSFSKFVAENYVIKK